MTGPNETYPNFTSFALFSTKVYCVNNLSLNSFTEFSFSFTEKRKKREHLASEHLLTRKNITRDVCLEMLYKASLYGLLAWTYFYNAKAKFWLQKLALGTGLDIEHIDWSPLTFSFLGWPQNVFSLTYRSATWKNRTRFKKKKKKSHSPGACISERTRKLGFSLYLTLWQIRVFFLKTKWYLLPKNPDASFWPEFLKFCLKEM